MYIYIYIHIYIYVPCKLWQFFFIISIIHQLLIFQFNDFHICHFHPGWCQSPHFGCGTGEGGRREMVKSYRLPCLRLLNKGWLGGGLKHIFYFYPLKIGDDPIWRLTHIFRIGCNHQLDHNLIKGKEHQIETIGWLRLEIIFAYIIQHDV